MTLLIIALLLCYVDRVLISLAGIEMQREFGWSDADKGRVFSVFFLGYLCMQFLGGFLSNRFGGRNVLMLAVLGWSVVTMITPAAAYAGFGVLIFTRFLLGFGEGAAYPSAYNLINHRMLPEENSLSVSLMGASSAIGTIFALLVVGKMIEWQGWSFVFYVFGGLGVIWCVIWILMIPNNASDSNDEKVATSRTKAPIKAMLFSLPVLPVYCTAIAYGVISFTLASWLPSYFVDTFALSISGAGFYSIVPWVAFALSAIWAGRLADQWISGGRSRLKVRKTLVAVGLIMSAAGCLLLIVVPNPLLAALSTGVVFAGLGVATPGYIPIPSELFPRHGDIFYGMMAASASVASIIVVAQTGVILEKTGSYDLLWVGLTVLCVVGTALFLRFATVTPVLAEDRAD